MNPDSFKISFDKTQSYNLLEELNNEPHPLEKCVMPMVLVKPDGVDVIGTAFTIAPRLMMTARHVVEEYLEHQAKLKTGAFQAGVLYLSDETVAGMPPNSRLGGILPVTFMSWNQSTDLALLNVDVPLVNDVPLRTPALQLRADPPPLGLPCCAIGSITSAEVTDYELGEVTVARELPASRGIILAHHPHGFVPNSPLYGFPCFDVNALFPHQMSGGPIIGSSTMGYSTDIFGVVSHGRDGLEGEGPLGRGAYVYSALGLETPVYDSATSTTKRMTLWEFAQAGRLSIAGLDRVTFDPATRRMSVTFPGVLADSAQQ